MGNRKAARNIVVIGGSAGALGPLIQIAGALPDDFPAALFAVLHTSPDAPGMIPMIVGRSSALAVRHAADGERFEPGCLYVAPPDRHLLLSEDRMEVMRGPRENRARPAIDPLFRTAARVFGSRVVGVLLSGVLNDGVYGLMAIKRRGGVAIVQDPEHADFPDMPKNAIEDVDVNHVAPPIEIANLIQELVTESETAEVPAMQDGKSRGADRQEGPRTETIEDPPAGSLAPFACPDCGGALWETQAGKLTRFRCHVGHALTAEVLLGGQEDEVEAALWVALRSLEENVELSRRLAKRASDAGHTRAAQQHQEHSNEMEQRTELVRRLLRGDPDASERYRKSS